MMGWIFQHLAPGILSQFELIGVHWANWMTMYDEDIVTCRPIMKYKGQRHDLSKP
jgi:hypothetical protein